MEKNWKGWKTFARTACMVCVGLTVMASAALADEAEPAAVNTEEATFVEVDKNVSSTLDGLRTVGIENE